MENNAHAADCDEITGLPRTLMDELRAFVRERDWAQFHDPKNLAMLVASEAGELCAEYRWVANAEADALSRTQPARARVADEIGDVGLALALLCDRMGLDLIAAMRAKLDRNRRRYPADLVRGRSERPQGPADPATE
jgi:NTP pyrophosphatase (non-canonical NTP hydrolase)